MADKQPIPLVWNTGVVSAIDPESGFLVGVDDAERTRLSRYALAIADDALSIMATEIARVGELLDDQ